MCLVRLSVIFCAILNVYSVVIIVEDAKACYRRTLAGKRVASRFVKRALSCETVDECQRECSEEKRFVCEGFNYRLDPDGRGKGECELLGLPLSELDIGRDLYPDRDYDYYERDRNAPLASCNHHRPTGGYIYHPPRHENGPSGGGYDSYGYPHRGYGPSSGGHDNYGAGDAPRRPGEYLPNRRPDNYGGRGDHGLRRPGDRWPEDEYRGNRRPPPNNYDDDKRYDDRPRPDDNRRGDFSYHNSHHSHQNNDYHNKNHFKDPHRKPQDQEYSGIHYLPAVIYQRPHYDYPPFEPPPLPPHRRIDRPPEKDHWGFHKFGWGSYGGSYGDLGYNTYHVHHQHANHNRFDFDHKPYFIALPPKVERPKDWGLYGGTYGNGGVKLQYNGYGHNYDYWGFNKFNDYDNYHHHHYHPVPKPFGGDTYLPAPPKPNFIGHDHDHFDHSIGYHSGSDEHFDNSILPAEPRRPIPYNFLKDECSLRTATGFKLHKGVTKKFFAVPNIYECELLCFREKSFLCASYAYRYTISLSSPTDNCYLSPRSYKELDYYSDIQPDRDFDIYTMNNPNNCDQPIVAIAKDNSDCFWRVRSGQRLDHSVVRDTLLVKSIVDCQLQCLTSVRFTCRSFSFRYGSAIIGGSADNCQLTDWPFYDLDPRIHFVPEPGFEVYDRGSYGHGCEPDHFGIGMRPDKAPPRSVDQLCYVGFGTPARLLEEATRKSLWVPTELECKAECSKSRQSSLFQCMSFSYRTGVPTGVPNCELSDVLQRDLLPNVDFTRDPFAHLFAWDNYNPECIAIINAPFQPPQSLESSEGIEERIGFIPVPTALDTWRVYSVSGWPCRRGSYCKENKEAGFWFCELEGGSHPAWDYCCRPDHHCGSSNGYPYQWCFVGPEKTQWRKCSDRYYPYPVHLIDDHHHYHHHHIFGGPPPGRPPFRKEPWIPSQDFVHEIPIPPPFRPGIRPNRPPAPPAELPPQPSLDEYEMQFANQFLDPPKPGGFGQPRHWPVSYLHKEMPPNITDESMSMKIENKTAKLSAIKNLINVIKSNDLKNVQYHIANESNKEDDILFVRIPLPTNFTKSARAEKTLKEDKNESIPSLEQIDIVDEKQILKNRSPKALPDNTYKVTLNLHNQTNVRPTPIYRRGYIERTNVTTHGRRSRIFT